MSEPAAVYSCPSCGALSKVDPAEGDGSVCRECGYEFRRAVRVAPRKSSPKGGRRFVQRDVVSRRRQIEREKTILPPEREGLAEIDTIADEAPGPDGDQVVSDDGHRRVVRRKKKRRRSSKIRPLLLGVAWIFIALVVFLILKQGMETNATAPPPIDAEEQKRLARAAEIKAYVDEHMGECRRILNEFWDASFEAGKAQFVYVPLRVTPSMYRYSQQHGFLKPRGEVRPVWTNLVAVNKLRAIETVWEDEDDQRFEVVFVRDKGKWKIDWEAYVRYSSTRWDVFVSGAVRGEGDFRLYMRRKRLSELDAGQHIGLKFYPAHYDVKSRRNGESPTVLVRADSELAAQVRAVLDGLNREVEQGAPALRSADAKDMARVRVVLEWQQTPKGEQFLHLKELKAGSWYAEEIVEVLEAPAGDDGSEREAGDVEPAADSGPAGSGADT